MLFDGAADENNPEAPILQQELIHTETVLKNLWQSLNLVKSQKNITFFYTIQATLTFV